MCVGSARERALLFALIVPTADAARARAAGAYADEAGSPGTLREAREESGIQGLRVDPTPIDVDCHRIPALPGEPEHWHLDARFMVRAPAPKKALHWLAPHELAGLETDHSMRRLFALAFGP